MSLIQKNALARSEKECRIDGPELHRIWIENQAGGKIQGSRDGGKHWIELGHVVLPIEGGVWTPAVEDKVMAYNYLRGPSDVFATAVNNLHLRFSDPPGYHLPEDKNIPPISAHGVSIAPRELQGEDDNDPTGKRRVASTDIPAGTAIFGAEWSPKIGSRSCVGDGQHFAPIPYEGGGPDSHNPLRSHILIITQASEHEVERIEFTNEVGGLVLAKRVGEEEKAVAKVLKPVKGIGRFGGSAYIPRPGTIRANHAGVLDIGTSDYRTDPDAPKNIPNAQIDDFHGSFQIVPSHHWQDESMKPNWPVEWAYLVVGPIIDPPSLERYDRGIEGQAPLFYQGVRAGTGKTSLMFKSEPGRWYELNEAIALGKFHQADGTVLRHLRGKIPDLLLDVERVRWEATDL